MKIKIEFDTESENFDNYELETYLHAREMLSCISEIKDKVRSWYKYDERTAIPTEEIWDSILDIINEHINLEKLGY